MPKVSQVTNLEISQEQEIWIVIIFAYREASRVQKGSNNFHGV